MEFAMQNLRRRGERCITGDAGRVDVALSRRARDFAKKAKSGKGKKEKLMLG
jgi:hypothetical protein